MPYHAITHEQHVQQVAAVHGNFVKVLGTYKNTRTPIEYECELGHRWKAAPKALTSAGSGCHVCSRLGKTLTHEQFVAKVTELHGNAIQVTGNYVSMRKDCAFQCKHGHEWTTKPATLMQARPGWGCPQCLHNTKYRHKKLKYAGHKWKKLLGYEPQAIRWLIDHGLSPRLIVAGGKAKVPVIDYKLDGKRRKHYPDIWVPSHSMLIEVKSIWTMLQNPYTQDHFRKLVAKRKAALKAGYGYTVMLMSPDGSRIHLPDGWWCMPKEQILAAI